MSAKSCVNQQSLFMHIPAMKATRLKLNIKILHQRKILSKELKSIFSIFAEYKIIFKIDVRKVIMLIIIIVNLAIL
jgi:hypothetical protein